MNRRRKNDILLKSIIEEFFGDMLRFVFPDADAVFNLNRDVIFLDKELLEIMPETENAGGSRFMDMLAKVWLQNGEQEWILVHIEIQGQNDPEFARRMFTYYYRTLDKFSRPITAFAIFTGGKGQQRFSFYERSFMGTRLLYEYNVIQIFDWQEEELLQKKNPFALVVLAAQKVSLSKKLSGEELNLHRIAIAREMIESKQYSHEKMMNFLHFLKNFIYIPDKEINSNFDRQMDYLTENVKPMGIIEALKYISREEGKETAIERIVINLIVKFGYSNEQIAAMTDAPLNTIESIRKKLNQ